MNKNLNLQDVFLNQTRKDRIPVTIFLMNGFQFKGMVRGFDSYIVILDCDGKQNVVYKHAISTIVPARPVNILESANTADTQ
ncbi:MAG: RNA chaperone Hfq [Oscillospiraceae bacterium]